MERYLVPESKHPVNGVEVGVQVTADYKERNAGSLVTETLTNGYKLILNIEQRLQRYLHKDAGEQINGLQATLLLTLTMV